MPVSPLRITPQSSKELLQLCRQATDLRFVLSGLQETHLAILSPKALRQKVEQYFSPELAQVLVKQLVALATFQRNSPQEPESVIEALILGVKELSDWDDDDVSKLEKIAPLLSKFLQNNHIIVVSKALALAFDFEHLLSDVRILIDVRPVFDSARDHVVGGLLCSKLRLVYSDQNTSRSISISIDKKEIEQLREMCDEALSKIDIMCQLLEEKCEITALATGEDFYDL